MKKIVVIFYGILTLGFVGYCVYVWPASKSTELKIAMLDIGQGDALYVRTPQGNDLVIDGGPDRTLLYELGEVMPPYDHKIEIVVATHDDLDHIGGLTELPAVYEVDTMINNGLHKKTAFSEALRVWEKDGTASNTLRVITPQRGDQLTVEQDLWLEFLNPRVAVTDSAGTEEDADMDLNDASVVFILHYKDFSALFTGDAGVVFEKDLIADYQAQGKELVTVDILKVAHHGSRTGTSAEFLKILQPRIALISTGIQNKFGHPHPGPLQRLINIGAQIWRTDEHGRVVCTTDGYAFSCK